MNKSPMPQIGDIISPIRDRERIEWWHKKSEPSGKFCRIIWNKQKKQHFAVCNRNFSSGIIAFIEGRLPEFNDLLQVTWSNDRVCKVKAIPRYMDDINIILKEYESNDQEAIEDLVFDYVSNEMVNDEFDDAEALLIYSRMMYGVMQSIRSQ